MSKLILTAEKTGKQMIAEFNRETAASMEDRGLTPEKVADKPMNGIPLFFYWAFKKNHPKVKKDETDELWAGLSEDDKKAVITRLMEMWQEAADSLMSGPEDESKKVKWEIG